jgi:excisionase family DNA binding protein
MESEFLAPKEVAAELRCDPDTIYRLIRSGELPAYRVGGLWRVKRADLETLRSHEGEEKEATA